ncbi:MAG: chalcone isomerase family protein [Burkholderiaceae bacterium]
MNTSRRGFVHRSAAMLAAGATFGSGLVPGTARANTGTPASIASQLPDARLAGEGDLRWFGLKVYTAQLWIGKPGLRLDRLAGVPFALDLRYATSLKGVLIADRSVQEMERMGFGDPQRRGRWHDAMKRLFPDVAKGDRLTGVNEPGRGARFFHNDRPLGGVDDPDFSAAFFAIWLDERTVAPSLREALVKQASTDSAGAPK